MSTEKKDKLDLVDALLQALMLALLMIGGHQIYVISKTEGFKMGFFKSYWIFMLLFVLIIVYQVRKNRKIPRQNPPPSPRAGKREKINKKKTKQ